MKTWHNRLQEALTARGKDWPELFAYLNAATGIKKPSVYAWKPDAERQSTILNGDNAALVCAWLQISPMWLFFEKGYSGLEQDDDLADLVSKYVRLTPSRKTTVKEVLHSLAATQEAEEDATQLRQPERLVYLNAK